MNHRRARLSVFLKDGGRIYHTYSTYARGLDMLNVTYPSWISFRRAATRPTAAPMCGFTIATSIRVMYGSRLLSRRSGSSASDARRLLPGVSSPDEGPRRQAGAGRPAVAALVVLAVAGVAWAAMVHHAHAMAGMDMGLGPIESFAVTWVVMMAAMMLPSALPVVLEFARTAEGRRRWQVATGVLALAYLGVWLVFGVVGYALYTAAGCPDQPGSGGWTGAGSGRRLLRQPDKRASQARCRELCALHGPLPFNLLRSAAVAGARYGLSCLGCSAALMVAMVLIGMSSLSWAVVLGVVVLIYKLAPPL